jgi:protein-S-isoprenylcysteine O-methyltransferase Ste14
MVMTSPMTAEPRLAWCDRAIHYGIVLWFLALSAFMLREVWHRLGQPLDAFAIAGLVSQSCAFLFLSTILCIMLQRPRPLAKAPGLRPRLAALLGSYLIFGMAIMPRAEIGIALNILSAALILCGNALAVIVLLNLGRSFSIMAEARRLVTNGPYALVRHPLYLAEQIGVVGLFIQVASWEALVVLGAQVYFQLHRMRNEEAVLALAFPEYAAYARRTARLIPAVW